MGPDFNKTFEVPKIIQNVLQYDQGPQLAILDSDSLLDQLISKHTKYAQQKAMLRHGTGTFCQLTDTLSPESA